MNVYVSKCARVCVFLHSTYIIQHTHTSAHTYVYVITDMLNYGCVCLSYSLVLYLTTVKMYIFFISIKTIYHLIDIIF